MFSKIQQQEQEKLDIIDLEKIENKKDKNESLFKAEYFQQGQKIEKLDQNSRQQKLEIIDQDYNDLLEVTSYGQKYSYTSLIRLILQKDYQDDESINVSEKQIPEKFISNREYNLIFQFLFMSECVAKTHQTLQTYKKSSNYTLRQPCNIKLIEQKNSEGYTEFTIIQGHSKKADQINENKKKIKKKNNETDLEQGEVGSDEEYVNDKDFEFDIKKQKNYLVIISTDYDLQIDKLSNQKFHKNECCFLGFLVPPEKAGHPTKIYTEVNNVKYDLKCTKNILNCYIFPLEKITTYIREFLAIRNIHSQQHLMRLLIHPNLLQQERHKDLIDYPKILEKFIDITISKFNPTQCQCIREICLVKSGICLLQGPPGTGKTHTLVGLVSGLYYYQKNNPDITINQKIMICAPSNTAIDEIIERLQKQGLIKVDGQNNKKVNIIRIGILGDNASDNVRETCIEYQAQQELAKQLGKESQTATEIKQKIEGINEKIQKLQKVYSKNQQMEEQNLKEIDKLVQQRKQYQQQLEKVRIIKQGNKQKYNKILNRILLGSDIICCTLSSSASEKLNPVQDLIECLIIDEAAQATEPNTLIPMKYGPKKVILIGDPKQLPATTFSKDSEITKYNRSLFERIIQNGVDPYFLDIQYRMNPAIREFPSKMFYNNMLKDSESIKNRYVPNFLLKMQKNVLFLDQLHSKQKSIESSYQNEIEAGTILEMIQYFCKKIGSKSTEQNTIGVITPYKQQTKLIKQLIRQKFDNYEQYLVKKYVMINTVDSFQGQEKDLIIFSSVRAIHNINDPKLLEKENLIGFLADERRLNVAITRAKFSIIILGNSDTLSSNNKWAQLIKHCYDTQSYIKVQNEQQNSVIWKQYIENNVQQIQKQYIEVKWNIKQKQKKTYTLQINDFTDNVESIENSVKDEDEEEESQNSNNDGQDNEDEFQEVDANNYYNYQNINEEMDNNIEDDEHSCENLKEINDSQENQEEDDIQIQIDEENVNKKLDKKQNLKNKEILNVDDSFDQLKNFYEPKKIQKIEKKNDINSSLNFNNNSNPTEINFIPQVPKLELHQAIQLREQLDNEQDLDLNDLL